jgi:hypothetical protein
LNFSFSRSFQVEGDLRLIAESSRERGTNGRAREGVQRQVEADNSRCSVFRYVQELDVERMHREHVAPFAPVTENAIDVLGIGW